MELKITKRITLQPDVDLEPIIELDEGGGMRELKFRRCNDYDYEFVYYDLKNSNDDDYINFITINYPIEQYTGLKDKNGKEIYEGDIVKLAGKVAQNKSTIYKVVWDSFLTGYDLISLEPGKNDIGYLNKTEIENRYEVIGNIHDNPELLSGTNVTNKEEE